MSGVWVIRGLMGGAATAAAMALSGCATMNEDQCLAGDWGGQGYRDGAAGHTMSRLDSHAKACAKYGVVPEMTVYASAREDGLRTYCTVERGFVVGRQGDSYNGVCPAELETDFVPAYNDGITLHTAESEADSARSTADSLDSRIDDLARRIENTRRELDAEGLTNDQRNALRARLGDLRNERDSTERAWRRAVTDVEFAEREASDIREAMRARYGSLV